MIKWIDDRSVMVHGKVTYGTGKGMKQIIPDGLLSDKRLDQLIEAGKLTIEYNRPEPAPTPAPSAPVVQLSRNERRALAKQKAAELASQKAGPIVSDPETASLLDDDVQEQDGDKD
jgi:hypothetical protein